MKLGTKTIFILMVLSCASYGLQAQSIYDIIKKEISNELSDKLGKQYKGNLKISNARDYKGDKIVSGSFDYQIQLALFGAGNTVNREYKAKVNVVLDRIVVSKLCYVYKEFYGGDPVVSCKCTDGDTVGSGHPLYVE